MKLKLQFGTIEPKRDVTWWQGVTNFPTLVIYKGNKWEFVMYQPDDTGQSDFILFFGEIYSYNPNFYATTYIDIDYMFNAGYSGNCECGAAYTSFKDGHMFFCKKWTKF